MYARAEAQQPRARAVDEHAQLVVCLAPLRVLEHGFRAVDSVARHADPRPDLLVLAEGIPNFAVTFFHDRMPPEHSFLVLSAARRTAGTGLRDRFPPRA